MEESFLIGMCHVIVHSSKLNWPTSKVLWERLTFFFQTAKYLAFVNTTLWVQYNAWFAKGCTITMFCHVQVRGQVFANAQPDANRMLLRQRWSGACMCFSIGMAAWVAMALSESLVVTWQVAKYNVLLKKMASRIFLQHVHLNWRKSISTFSST